MALALLAACVAPPKKDLALERVRHELDDLKSNPELAGYAPLAVGEAERALRNAELATGDKLARAYLVYMADRRIQIARAMAERLRRAVCGEVVHTSCGPVSVTLSAGVGACRDGHGASAEDLVRTADEALYAAKAGGRNRVEMAEHVDVLVALEEGTACG